MIMTVEELKTYITTTAPDALLSAKMQAIELMIRKHTNNNFQKRSIRLYCAVMTQKLYLTTDLLKVGDTVQISDSIFNDGIYVITEKDDDYITLNKTILDESFVMVTLVEYPMDIKLGVAGMIEWELTTGKKVGIQSETISRHSVTYFNMDGDNSSLGYPKSLTGFLKPYMKARF